MSTENGPVRLSTMATRPTEPEHLPCPRCDSTNTKFCYYNNYNLSQPRHFCKSCRRYWTRGGTLRNVPVGGGSRKSSASSNKRLRTNATTPTTAATANVTATTASSSSDVTHEPLHATPVSMVSQMGSGSTHMAGSLAGCEVNLNEAVPEAASFSSLLTTQVGAGYLPFGSGFGLGTGPGMHGLGFGLGMMDWPMESVSQANGNVGVGVEGGESGGGGGGGGHGSGASSGCNAWQIGGVEGGLGDGDCFGWPDLAISMPGKGLK